MSLPREPEPVKLVASLFSPEKGLPEHMAHALSQTYGPMDRISEELLFDRTRYYAREMGWPLYRRFISFRELVHPENLVEIKITTNQVEQQHLRGESRSVNIDPGILSAERLVLATGKNYVHRVYLRKGIYADLTLLYRKGSFRPLPWTYPDYKDPQIISFFNGVRDLYMEQLREKRRLD